MCFYMLNVAVLVVFTVALAVFFFLFPERGEGGRLWRATVTPLASIIGSGYLVSAPLLYYSLGIHALFGMLGIVILAYVMGSAIRYNILFAEPVLLGKAKSDRESLLKEMEGLSNLVISFAYMISTAFYLRLLSAFVFSGFFGRNPLYENVLTSAILLFIGISGYVRGLNFLEFLEKYAVSLKLAVISAFLFGLLLYDLHHAKVFGEAKPLTFGSLQILAGILLIVQGFETSKYLGEEYTPEERVKSMRLAQLISGGIYLATILLLTPILHTLSLSKVDETAIIALAAGVCVALGYLMKLGPLMSQFSAAVADTIGSGGLIREETHGRISSNTAYLFTASVGLVLVWSTDIFHIITYASKAFAFYYLLQTLIALFVATERRDFKRTGLFVLVALALAFVVLFGKSAE